MIGGTFASVFAFRASGKPLPWPFGNVTQAQLNRAGLTLTPLATPTNLPKRLATGRQIAALVKADDHYGSRSRNLAPPQYMHCDDWDASNPSINEDCWAVVVNPTNFPLMGAAGLPPLAPFKWGIVLVSSKTGKIIEARAGY